MTVALSGKEVAGKLEPQFPASVIDSYKEIITVKSESIFDIISFLKNTPAYGFNYLSSITAVDYYDYFEVVYQLTSLTHNHTLVVKTRCENRESPVVPSVVGLWQGQEGVMSLYGVGEPSCGGRWRELVSRRRKPAAWLSATGPERRRWSSSSPVKGSTRGNKQRVTSSEDLTH